MTEFRVPERAQRAAAAETEKKKQADRKGQLGGYAGFICGHCKVPIDSELRGEHALDCPNLPHNDRLYAEAKLGRYVKNDES